MDTCPHCIALKPTWAVVKKKIAKIPGISCAEIEYHQMIQLPSSLQKVSGFPTIQVIQNGRVKAEYAGDRSVESILAFARPYAVLPPSQIMTRSKTRAASSSIQAAPTKKPKLADASDKKAKKQSK